MILIADSGSTKTHWRTIDANGAIEQAQTKGFNPYYQSKEELQQELQTSLRTQIQADIRQIFYYGAGCNNSTQNDMVRDALAGVFAAADIEVHSDLLGVARALCGRQSGIACILGTGSNSCYYDGQHIIDNIPPWGTWLGDEGSGSVLGRHLVVAYLNNEMPETLNRSFTKRYPNLRDTVLDHIHNQPYPNRYLGQFSKFLFHHLADPWVHQLVYENFELFITRKVLKYPQSKEVAVHFSGSVAFYFNGILRQAAQDQGLTVKNILENPIAGLALYHLPG